jgi:hypothetical protein
VDLTQIRIHTLPGLTIFIFGLLAAALGILGIIRPEFILSTLSFEIIERADRVAGDYTLVFITASSMASLNMGVYYVLASVNNLRQFYTWTVPFRILTFSIFTLAVVNGIAPAGFIGVAAWELIGALATGMALVYERRREAA